MKIEKVNDHQIRCTLTQEDLEERHIKLSELAYGSEKANRLFHDMMEQANKSFGFDVDNIPIMVEAVPLPGDQIMLLITKVDSPEELDTRFSNFTSAAGEGDDEFPADLLPESAVEEAAQELMELFDKLGKGKAAQASASETAEGAPAKEESAKADSISGVEKTNEQNNSNMVRIFTGATMDDMIHAAHAMDGIEMADNVLFKHPATGVYYLVLIQGDMDALAFKRISFKLASHIHSHKYTPAILANINEHYQMIIPQNALELLAQLD